MQSSQLRAHGLAARGRDLVLLFASLALVAERDDPAALGQRRERAVERACGEPNEYEYRVQYIYESRDGQRTDYVKTLADMGVEKVGDMGSFLVLRKRADGAPFTLYSDLDAQIMDARRLMRIKIILAVAFALLAADWFYNTWVWYDLAVSFDAMYADLRETYHQPSFLSLRLWGKHIVWYAVLGVLGTAVAVRTAMQAAHVGKTYGELKRKRLIEE